MVESRNSEERLPSYGEATRRLSEIIDALEEGEIDIDELADNMKEAARLIQICKQKIDRAEMEVIEVTQHLEEDLEEKAETEAIIEDEGPTEGSNDVPF